MALLAEMSCLVKFNLKRHIEDFARGRLFMRTLREFAEDFEGDVLRGDDHEGVSHLVQATGATLSIFQEGSWHELGTIAGAIRRHAHKALDVNVFCMHAMTVSEKPFMIDPANLDFGDAFAIVTKPDEFLRRVKNADLPPGNEVTWGLVSYVDGLAYSGPMGPFSKRKVFEHQSEFRIVMNPGLGERHTLEIGNISDILVVGQTTDLRDRHLRFISPAKPTAPHTGTPT